MKVAFDITKHPDYREVAEGDPQPTYGGLPGVPMADLDEPTWRGLSVTQQRSVIANPMYRVPKDWRQAFQGDEAKRQKDAEKRGLIVSTPVVIEADEPRTTRRTNAKDPAAEAATEG